MDITWEANYAGQVITCEHHGERNTVVTCPVCVGYARMVIVRYERMLAALKEYTDLNDSCLICGEWPSDGHLGDCIFDNSEQRKKTMTHPLDDEDLHIEINHLADSPKVSVTVTHIPTGCSVNSVGTDEDIVRGIAMDELLDMLENISG